MSNENPQQETYMYGDYNNIRTTVNGELLTDEINNQIYANSNKHITNESENV